MRWQTVIVAGLLLIFFTIPPAHARTKARSGTYKNRAGTGTFQQQIDRQKGSTSRKTQWTDQNGRTGTRDVKAAASNGKGHYSATTNTPDGRSLSTNKNWAKNDDGSYTVTSDYTTGSGKTLSTEKTIKKTADGVASAGTYQTGSGRTGTYNTSASLQDGQLVRTRSLTDVQGRTVSHESVSSVSDGTLTRRDTLTGPDGQTYGAITTATAKIQERSLVTDVNTTTDKGATFGHHVETDIGPGRVSQQVTNTGPNGNSRTFTRSITVDSSSQTTAP